MKNAICIVDYIGHSDENGNPVGHPIKTTNEYNKLLKRDIDINLAIPKNYNGKVNFENIKKTVWLDHYTNVTITNFKTKITKTINKLANIRKTLENDDSKVIWFINMDFALGLAFMLFPSMRKRKIWITNYLHEYTDGSKLSNSIKNFLFYKIMNNVDRIISSNETQQNYNNKLVYVPDYFYDPEAYKKYRVNDKKDQVACLGTMSESKDLEALVKTFKNMTVPLKINGNFYDKERYKNLLNSADKNIEIQDINLDYDDYYKILGESKYIILPYKKEFYNQRTSGVLLETIFLESIPIAPKFLLELNKIKGIAFDEIDDVIHEIESHESRTEEVIDFNNNIINKTYNINYIRKKLIDCFIDDIEASK